MEPSTISQTVYPKYFSKCYLLSVFYSLNCFSTQTTPEVNVRNYPNETVQSLSNGVVNIYKPSLSKVREQLHELT